MNIKTFTIGQDNLYNLKNNINNYKIFLKKNIKIKQLDKIIYIIYKI